MTELDQHRSGRLLKWLKLSYNTSELESKIEPPKYMYISNLLTSIRQSLQRFLPSSPRCPYCSSFPKGKIHYSHVYKCKRPIYQFKLLNKKGKMAIPSLTKVSRSWMRFVSTVWVNGGYQSLSWRSLAIINICQCVLDPLRCLHVH